MNNTLRALLRRIVARLVVAVAILFSTFSTPILSSIFSLAFYMIGHLSWSLDALIQKMRPGLGRNVTQILYTFLPDLENFNFKTEVVHGLTIPSDTFIYSTLYGVAYTGFILVLATLIFRNRDFV